MEVTDGTEEAFVREWTPCNHILNLIPPRTQNGLFSSELCLTCVDAVSEFIALGTNVGLVYWYDRKKGTIQRLRCEVTSSPITFVKIANTVDYMVAAGNASGQVSVFQIPKEHPENVPDTYKPKVEPKVERYTIGDLHKSKVTAIEWSKNGMRLFSGDKNGVIIMTEIDFYMHLCKSMEIVNEQHEIVQLSYHQNSLLVSSVYRTILCERRDTKWQVNQIGKKERKSVCRLGAVFQHSYARLAGGARPAAYCARAGLRLWRADASGEVQQTLLFKDAISNPLTVAELLNPCHKKQAESEQHEPQFSSLHVFREHFLVAHDERSVFVLDPRAITAVAAIHDLRRVLSVSVNKDEIFILEGPRSLVRLAHTPEPASMAADDPINLMTKSLTTSIQQAVNTVKDLTHIDQTVPFITSVLEQPISIFSKTGDAETGIVVNGEECFELPPIKQLPDDIPANILDSIINEFKDVTGEAEEIRRNKTEELQKKLKLYDSIMEKKPDGELIHSRKSRKREVGSEGSTPSTNTPVRKPTDVSYTSPCVMSVSVYSDIPENDDVLEKQIEEKEKILAKLLNLESFTIEPTEVAAKDEEEDATEISNYDTTQLETENPVNVDEIIEDSPEPLKTPIISNSILKGPKLLDSVPKVEKLPNNWNLENIELRLESKSNNVKTNLLTPADESVLDSEWEII